MILHNTPPRTERKPAAPKPVGTESRQLKEKKVKSETSVKGEVESFDKKLASAVEKCEKEKKPKLVSIEKEGEGGDETPSIQPPFMGGKDTKSPLLKEESIKTHSQKKDIKNTEDLKNLKKGEGLAVRGKSSLKSIQGAQNAKASKDTEKVDLKKEDKETEVDETVLSQATVTLNGDIIPFPSSKTSSKGQEPKLSRKVKAEGKTKANKDGGKVSEEPKLTVLDLRRNEKVKDIKSSETGDQAKLSLTDSSGNEIVLGESQDKIAGEESGSFSSRFKENREIVLARELKNSGNEQIVKKASFILKDNEMGEIKLILKPESLGQVKINLNIHENNLVGKIIVENSRVGQIFENNLNELSRAFEEAGMDSSSLQVTVGDGGEKDQNGYFDQTDQPFYSDRLKSLDESVPLVDNGVNNLAFGKIDLVV